MKWVKWILIVIAWLIAFAVMENWPTFERAMVGAVAGLVYYCYTISKEVETLKLRLDSLIHQLDSRSD